MKGSIPCLISDFNFFLNRILIYGCSQISDLFHPLKETVINVYTLTSSKLVYCTKIEFQPHREHVAHYKQPRTNTGTAEVPFVSKTRNIFASTSHPPNTAALQYGYAM